MDIVLTATVHDPVGRLAPATRRLAGSLRGIFTHIALNVSDATRPEVLMEIEALGADIMTHAAGEAIIARRGAMRWPWRWGGRRSMPISIICCAGSNAIRKI